MEILKSDENPVPGLSASRSQVKFESATNQYPKKSKRALADVGNTIHQSNKTSSTFFKSSETSSKNLTSCIEKKRSSDEDLMSAGSEIKIVAKLSPCYYYDSEDEDMHDGCFADSLHDDFDCVLPLSLRFDSDDLDSLASFKPAKTLWGNLWKDDLPTVSDESDLDDFSVPFPSPEKNSFKLPFSDFVVPGINLDFSF